MNETAYAVRSFGIPSDGQVEEMEGSAAWKPGRALKTTRCAVSGPNAEHTGGTHAGEATQPKTARQMS